MRGMPTVRVELGARSYPIHIGQDLLCRAGLEVAGLGASKAMLLSSPAIFSLYGEAVLRSVREAGVACVVHLLADGEEAKQWGGLGQALSAMAAAGLDRSSVVVALGGGAIGDAAGCAAGLYMRGIRCVQIPTTLLSMVDSSVGGKTGVNLPEGKNLVGVFQQPSVVLADTGVLESLPLREMRAGSAEVIKYGVIRDAVLFAELEKGWPGDWTPHIVRSVEIKARVVEADEHEKLDIRALLNFGHTVGHAVEAAAGFGRLLHGEAVGVGMAAAAWLSVRRAGLAGAEAARILSVVEQYGLPSTAPGLDRGEVLEHLFRDKKFTKGQIRFVLARAVGEALVSGEVTRSDIEEAVDLALLAQPAWRGAVGA